MFTIYKVPFWFSSEECYLPKLIIHPASSSFCILLPLHCQFFHFEMGLEVCQRFKGLMRAEGNKNQKRGKRTETSRVLGEDL
jgi:hypothetical protein